MPIKAIHKFTQLESAGGIILFSAALIALILSNSPFATFYQDLFNVPFQLKIKQWVVETSLSWWINDCLMVFFFFMVCLDIKWQMFQGELKSTSSKILPLIAALGGMIFPALIYILINKNNSGVDPDVYKGWAIPTATDIAFSLGILSLLGKKIPPALKVLLGAIAIFDDLGAIIIIAFFYTNKLNITALGLVLLTSSILFVLNRLQVTKIILYCIAGFFLWLCLLKSGIHPTIAGVITAFAIPIQPAKHLTPLKKQATPNLQPLIIRLSASLHPWVTFLILPLFAFANAGISLSLSSSIKALTHPVTWGIAAGLLLGKQIGIFSSIILTVKFKLCKLPEALYWSHIYGMALICGVGFTMSLFIGSLAFEGMSQLYEALVRWGVMLGSLTSGSLGYCFLLLSRQRRPIGVSFREK